MKPIAALMAFLLATTAVAAAFERPSENECRRALGNLFEEPEPLRTFLTPDGDFRPVPLPRPTDWLAQHPERGQSYDEFRTWTTHQPDATRHTLYLLPFGDFSEDAGPSLAEMRAYAAHFFQMEVKLLPPYYPHDLEFSPRQHARGGQRQLLTTDILRFLETKLPPDAYCILGITLDDLYPQPAWNYVFGQASLENRVGIYSLARYDPAFWKEERGARYRELMLQRACKVLVHETAHMFGLQHCIYYECVVNGSNGLTETDGQPQSLCPVCLRKLHAAIGFDARKRYTDLARFYRAHQWFDELDLANRQLARIRPPE